MILQNKNKTHSKKSGLTKRSRRAKMLTFLLLFLHLCAYVDLVWKQITPKNPKSYNHVANLKLWYHMPTESDKIVKIVLSRIHCHRPSATCKIIFKGRFRNWCLWQFQSGKQKTISIYPSSIISCTFINQFELLRFL